MDCGLAWNTGELVIVRLSKYLSRCHRRRREDNILHGCSLRTLGSGPTGPALTQVLLYLEMLYVFDGTSERILELLHSVESS